MERPPLPLRRFVAVVAAAWGVLVGVLLLDRPGLPAQAALGVVTTLLLVWMVRGSSVPPAQVFVAVLIASAGEVLGSIILKAYEYRSGGIPFYVPPGHGVFYFLACESSGQPGFRRIERGFVAVVFAGGAVYAAASLAWLGDVLGFLWWMGAAALIRFTKRSLLFSLCFVYTLALEWIGTTIGNWAWAPVAPIFGVRAANPPSGVGILYCLVDLAAIAVCGAFARRPREPEARGEAVNAE